MANEWLRLWHDMPNDPKWRTVAKVSKQPIALVQAMYLHLMVDASRNVTRGHVDVTLEDLASALDCDMSQIEAIYEAMQGRVLDGNVLTGWDRRQPKREDLGNPNTGAKSAAQRKAEQRQRDREQLANNCDANPVTNNHDKKEAVTPRHGVSRKVTTDKDKDKEYISTSLRSVERRASRLPPDWQLPDDWRMWAKQIRPEIDVDRAAASFADYWHSKAGKGGCKLDWQATWRNWVRNERTPPSRQPVLAASSHAGFDNMNYSEGVTADGAIE